MSIKLLNDARYSIQQEYCGFAKPRWVVRFCGDWIDQRDSEQKAMQLALEHKAQRMRNIATNKHPTTGIAYGYIAADKLHPDVVQDLQFGRQARDVHYEAAKADYLDAARKEYDAMVEEARIARAELDGGTLREEDIEDFDEAFHVEQFSDKWLDDEPVHQGTHEGVRYQTSWLGGALNVWVFESPVTVKCCPCSPCVPGAGDLNTLDSENGMETYGVPTDWLYVEPT